MFRNRFAALAMVGVLALGAGVASAWNQAITATRTVRILTEDTFCQNLNAGAGPDAAKNQYCNSAGFPFACCTGVGTGTCDADNLVPGKGPDTVTNNNCIWPGAAYVQTGPPFTGPIGQACCTGFQTGTCNADNTNVSVEPPLFSAPSAGCETYATDYSDTDGTKTGSTDFNAKLTNLGATLWQVEVSAAAYLPTITKTLGQSGATVTSNTSFKMSIDTAAAPASQVTPLNTATVGGVAGRPVFYSATGAYPGPIAFELYGLQPPGARDKAFFGVASDTSDPAFLSLSVPPPMISQCLAAGTPYPCCTGFLTGAACPGAFAQGPAVTLSCAAAWNTTAGTDTFGPAAFGPGIPTAAPGVPDFSLCNPPGIQFGGDPGDNYVTQPGFTTPDTLVAWSVGRTYIPGLSANAITPAVAVLDFKIVEVDTDGDTIRDDVDTDDDNDGVTDLSDNCRVITNLNQGDADSDGFGNRCDPDISGNGTVSLGDLNQFKTNYNLGNLVADISDNGTVSLGDLNQFKALYNQTGLGLDASGGRMDSCIAPHTSPMCN